LPRDGEKAVDRRAVDFVRTDAVTCGRHEPIAAVRQRVDGSPYGFAFVISDGGVLLGRLRRPVLEGESDRRAEEVMEPGPSTVRPDTPAAELHERLESRKLRTAVLSDPDGMLLGIVLASDLT
jgi:CBS domain-containing protein